MESCSATQPWSSFFPEEISVNFSVKQRFSSLSGRNEKGAAASS